jgi:uncharacterized protein
MYLLDANCLIALGDADHEHHERMRKWFKAHASEGWGTCPLTENAFVRILSHPGYPNSPGDASQARALLRELCLFRGHRFWADELTIRSAEHLPVLSAPKQITDLYLLALAAHLSIRFVTLDARIKPDLIPGGEKAFYLIPLGAT